MTKEAPQTVGASHLSDGLGFAQHSLEHLAWLKTLKKGDAVCILQPWFDDVEKGGRRVPDTVEEIGQLVNGVETIHTKSFGVFYRNVGADFNKIIMPPNAKLRGDLPVDDDKRNDR